MPRSRLCLKPGAAAGLGQIAYAQDVGLPFRHGDDAARIEKIENVRRLDALVVGRQDALVMSLPAPIARFQTAPCIRSSASRKCCSSRPVSAYSKLCLGSIPAPLAGKYVAVADLFVAVTTVGNSAHRHLSTALAIHGETFKPVGQLARKPAQQSKPPTC